MLPLVSRRLWAAVEEYCSHFNTPHPLPAPVVTEAPRPGRLQIRGSALRYPRLAKHATPTPHPPLPTITETCGLDVRTIYLVGKLTTCHLCPNNITDLAYIYRDMRLCRSCHSEDPEARIAPMYCARAMVKRFGAMLGDWIHECD